jgi:hypothetical protein
LLFFFTGLGLNSNSSDAILSVVFLQSVAGQALPCLWDASRKKKTNQSMRNSFAKSLTNKGLAKIVKPDGCALA